jgi:hypothetical protein
MPSPADIGIKQRIISVLQPPDWLRPWMVTTLLTVILCLFTLAQSVWDPLAFAMIGRQFDPARGTLEMGYDGQFSYQIARDPAGAAPYLDVPAYRYQRILYPLLGHILALGNTAAIPWMLILINIAGMALGTLATEKILAQHGFSRWYALAYGAFAGLLLSVRMDLTEPVAFALVQWGILFFDRGKLWRSMLLFALASLGRELTLLFAAACVLSLLSNRRYRTGCLWGIGAALPFGLWQVYLRFWLGDWGLKSGGALATSFEPIPFKGWWGANFDSVQMFVVLTLIVAAITFIPSILAIISGLKSLWKGHTGLGVWILLINALIFPFLPSSTVLSLPGLVRITIGLVVAVLDFGALESSRRALLYSQLWLFLLAFGQGLLIVR